ncbi:MFS transporter [Vibrio rhizosphaerae]|uniref:MFS transporter n=1 Tax=Vibrio rhizosphaerae TaxID=398736 RepID=A0ABU4IRW5_9VIBR|nr:MFS transporter [Vibrio rhizosphaerae]MDW6092139.1 MFS transporter [Vibrio rhizosphaerae]
MKETTRILTNTKILLILSAIFFVNIGSYLVTPYYVVYVSGELSLGLAFAGLLLTVKTIAQRGLGLLGGVLTDMYSARFIASVGLLARALSFIILAVSPTPAFLFLSAFLNGIGSAFFSPASKVLLFDAGKDINRKQLISIRSLAVNSGIALGPVIGLLTIGAGFTKLCIISALTYFIVFILFFSFFSKSSSTIGKKNFQWREAITVLKNRHAQFLMTQQFLFFLCYATFELIMPAFFNERLGSMGPYIVFGINAITVVVVQYLIINYRMNALFALDSYFIFGAFALLLLATLSSSLYLFIFAAVCGVISFSHAEVFSTVKIEDGLLQNSPDLIQGTVLGLLSLMASAGMVISNYLSPIILKNLGYSVLWSCFIGVFFIYHFFNILTQRMMLTLDVNPPQL